MHEPTHLDLFSGIGGFALAARWAGFRTIAFSEIDRYASAVLKKHWPEVPNLGDIRRFSEWPDFGNVSVLTGGFPCQPWSVAGKRRGAGDDRHLWPAMLQVIGRFRPAWVCGENVPGLIGMGLDQMLADLEGIGYRVQPFVIPACAVDAHHRRDRLWIVANASERRLRCPGERGARSGIISARQRRPKQTAADPDGSREDVADAKSPGFSNGGQSRKPPGEGQENGQVAFAEPERCSGSIWPVEPDVGRVAHGVSARVDRIKCLGNAIVPQVAFEILKAIRAQIG